MFLDAFLAVCVCVRPPSNSSVLIFLRLNPEYDQAMNNLANILKDQGKDVEAEVFLDKAVSIS